LCATSSGAARAACAALSTGASASDGRRATCGGAGAGPSRAAGPAGRSHTTIAARTQRCRTVAGGRGGTSADTAESTRLHRAHIAHVAVDQAGRMDTAGNQQGHGGQVPKGADARWLSMDTVDVDVDRHGLFPL